MSTADKLSKVTSHEIIPVDPMDALVQKAVESGAVDVLERLLKVRQQVQADRARDAFYSALIGFQNACPVIEKSAQANIKPGFSYRYTPIEDIAHAIRELLNQFQLGYRWFTEQTGKDMTVTCRISHSMGHMEETKLTVPVGVDPQRPAWPVAQSLTYAKRYTLCNALGIVVGGEDDDAHEVTTTAAPQEAKVPIQPPQEKPSSATGSSQEGPAVAVIADVQLKTGTNAKGNPWTRYGIICDNGETYSTFDTKIGEAAQSLIGNEVALSWERDKSGKYLTCTRVEPMIVEPLVVEPSLD